MKAQGVVIPEDKDDLARKFKVRQTLFERAVARMTDGYEPGFVGRHHEQVNTVRELSGRIREMDNRLKELQAQAVRLEAEYKERQVHKTAVEKKLVAARAETLRLANDLARLLDQRFRAQVEYSDADRRNQLMERRLRELERAPKKGKGGRP
jgi:chromosome segregation ATPase